MTVNPPGWNAQPMTLPPRRRPLGIAQGRVVAVLAVFLLLASPGAAPAQDALPAPVMNPAAATLPGPAAAPAQDTLPAPATNPAAATLPEPAAAPAPASVLAMPAEADVPDGGLNPRAMVLNAVPVVKFVVLILALASLLSWMMLGVKAFEIIRLGHSLRRAAVQLHAARTLGDATGIDDAPVRAMLESARHEIKVSAELYHAGLHEGIKERVQALLLRIEDGCARRMASGLGIFATIGGVTPFIGLFGTVWGIMHSFIGISRAQTTSLAVIAPGIAEALLATSLGLVAAVPATVMYNVIGRRISLYRARLADCTTLVLCLVSRDADRQTLPQTERPRAVARV